MRKRTFLFLLIVFATVGLIGYFITQPVIQAQDALQYGTITGNVYYSGIDCHFATGDHVDVYRIRWFNDTLAVHVFGAQVQFFKDYYYVVTEDDLENQAGYYRLVPDLYSASGNAGVSPQVREMWWEPGRIIQNQNFTADACNHP